MQDPSLVIMTAKAADAIALRIVPAFLLLVSLLGVAGAVRAHEPEPDPSPPGETVESLFFDSHGVRLRYVEEGAGEPVLLIHGFSLDLQLQWMRPGIVSALSDAGYRVIAYDKRGHGASAKPRDRAAYGVPDVKDAIRLLDQLEIERAHVIGYSRGARIAHHLRAEYPGRLRSLVLGGYGEGADDDDALGVAVRSSMADAMERGDYRPLLRAVAPELAAEDIEAWNRQLGEMNDGQALSAAFRADLSLPSFSDRELRTNQVPALAIIGEDDPFREGVESMRAVMGRLEVVALPGADHASTLGRPEFLTAVLGFIGKHGEVREP